MLFVFVVNSTVEGSECRRLSDSNIRGFGIVQKSNCYQHINVYTPQDPEVIRIL